MVRSKAQSTGSDSRPPLKHDSTTLTGGSMMICRGAWPLSGGVAPVRGCGPVVRKVGIPLSLNQIFKKIRDPGRHFVGVLCPAPHKPPFKNPNRPTCSGVMTSDRFLRWQHRRRNTTSGFVFGDVTLFRKSKSVCKLNVVNISIHEAELLSIIEYFAKSLKVV